MGDDKITQQELAGMFGATLPIEVVNLIFGEKSAGMTVGEVRARVREIAAGTPAPATPEEVDAAIRVLSHAYDRLGLTVRAALNIVLPALASSKAEIERVTAELADERNDHSHARMSLAESNDENAALKAEIERVKKELADMKSAAASVAASVVAGSALMAEENLDRQELKQQARAAKAEIERLTMELATARRRRKASDEERRAQ